MAVKSNGSMIRNEWEMEIPQWVFQELLPNNSNHPRIYKTVYKSQLGDLVLEFHYFAGPLNGLIMLECEFPDEETAIKFNLPEDLNSSAIKEVTNDPRYYNKNLASYGLPE